MAEKNVQEELDLEKKVTVRNIAGWNVGFARRVDGLVMLPLLQMAALS